MRVDNINHLHSGLITQLSAQEDHNAKHEWTTVHSKPARTMDHWLRRGEFYTWSMLWGTEATEWVIY